MSSKKGKRRRWSAEDKLRIVLAGLEPGVEISELYRREGITPTQYYSSKKALISSASRVFNKQSQKPSRKEGRASDDGAITLQGCDCGDHG